MTKFIAVVAVLGAVLFAAGEITGINDLLAEYIGAAETHADVYVPPAGPEPPTFPCGNGWPPGCCMSP